ncbi:hypothetical protein [Dyadobacter sp. 22481]|uniref:hypothetical protein n=1 Tax=Dyadobacter sp. 22481 TaxID=3453926 RepID=UPI003F875886
MDKVELLAKLNELDASEEMYSLEGGTPPERMVVEQNGTVFDVYYSERGVKVDLRTFLSIGEAYDYLYSVFKTWKEKGYL